MKPENKTKERKMKTKTICGRCGGSGNYSFNLIDGTVCYGRNGSGFQMVDLAAVAKKQAAAAKRQAAAAVNAEAFAAARSAVLTEMNAKFGPFQLMNEGFDALPGYYKLCAAVLAHTGMDIADHCKARLA